MNPIKMRERKVKSSVALALPAVRKLFKKFGFTSIRGATRVIIAERARAAKSLKKAQAKVVSLRKKLNR